MSSPDGRLDLEFTPFIERVAKANLLLITSEVHQMFGRYTCTAQNRLRCSAGVAAPSSLTTAK